MFLNHTAAHDGAPPVATTLAGFPGERAVISGLDVVSPTAPWRLLRTLPNGGGVYEASVDVEYSALADTHLGDPLIPTRDHLTNSNNKFEGFTA